VTAVALVALVAGFIVTGCERNESPCRLNGEDTEHMYSKHLTIYTAILPQTGMLAV